MKTLIKNVINKDWFLFISRPLNLFESSLVHKNFVSEYFSPVSRNSIDSLLFVQNPKLRNIVQLYLRKSEFKRLLIAKEQLFDNNLKQVESFLDKAERMNNEIKNIMSRPQAYRVSISEMIEFITQSNVYCTLIPYFIDESLSDKRLFAKALKLRTVSLFYGFMEKVFIPRITQELKINKLAPDTINFITADELLHNNFSNAQTRKNKYAPNYRFIYHVQKGEESVWYAPDTEPIINKIEGVKKNDANKQTSTLLKGTVAYRGIIRGPALVVEDFRNPPSDCTSSDIIISVNANPNLTPLLIKSAAIITDEGGITCHGAVLAREHKKPCIVGTKFATSTITTGDFILVDANKGFVKFINKIKR